MNKDARITEFVGYGYTVLGEHRDLTMVAKKFEDDSFLLMSISDKVVTQIPLSLEQVKMMLVL